MSRQIRMDDNVLFMFVSNYRDGYNAVRLVAVGTLNAIDPPFLIEVKPRGNRLWHTYSRIWNYKDGKKEMLLLVESMAPNGGKEKLRRQRRKL